MQKITNSMRKVSIVYTNLCGYQKRNYAHSALLDGYFSSIQMHDKINLVCNFLSKNGYIVNKHLLGEDILPDKLVINKIQSK
jgi:hypothetical protein